MAWEGKPPPTPEEIAQRAAAIRDGWDDDTKLVRSGGLPPHLRIGRDSPQLIERRSTIVFANTEHPKLTRSFGITIFGLLVLACSGASWRGQKPKEFAYTVEQAFAGKRKILGADRGEEDFRYEHALTIIRDEFGNAVEVREVYRSDVDDKLIVRRHFKEADRRQAVARFRELLQDTKTLSDWVDFGAAEGIGTPIGANQLIDEDWHPTEKIFQQDRSVSGGQYNLYELRVVTSRQRRTQGD